MLRLENQSNSTNSPRICKTFARHLANQTGGQELGSGRRPTAARGKADTKRLLLAVAAAPHSRVPFQYLAASLDRARPPLAIRRENKTSQH